MARSRRTKVAFRRRREGKTNYHRRRKLIQSGKRRVVVRKTNTQTSIQLVSSLANGDSTHCQITTRLLTSFGWNGGTNNIPSAYLTGFYFGKKALQKKIVDDEERLILDIGMETKFYGGRIFAVLKGASDAGLNIAYGNDKIFPSEDRIKGEHIAKFSKDLGKDGAPQFAKYKIDPTKIPKHFEEIKDKINKSKTL